MKIKYLKPLALTALVATILAGPVLAQTAPLTLVTYSVIEAPQVVDVAPEGPSVGDMYLRHGKVSLTPDGPTVGEYASQAVIVFFDSVAKRSSRTFNSEVVLPEGTIYKMDFVQSDHGRPMTVGHKHQGAIVGGTGQYAGIRGSYEIEMMASGKMAKTTHNFWLGQ